MSLVLGLKLLGDTCRLIASQRPYSYYADAAARTSKWRVRIRVAVSLVLGLKLLGGSDHLRREVDGLRLVREGVERIEVEVAVGVGRSRVDLFPCLEVLGGRGQLAWVRVRVKVRVWVGSR